MNKISHFIKMAEDGTVPESTLVKASAFKDHLNQRKLVKTAAPVGGRPNGPGFGQVLLYGLGLGLGAAAATAGFDAIYDKWLDRKKMPAFKKMLEYHPALAKEDPETIARYFDSVWHFSPHLAQDPMAAGAYIRTALSFHGVYGGPTTNMAKDIAGLQKDVRSVDRSRGANPFASAFEKINLPAINLDKD